MLEHIKKINSDFSKIREAVNKVTIIAECRKHYLKDPKTTILGIGSNTTHLNPLLKYQDIFINDINVTVAKDDALEDINTILVSSVDDLSKLEAELYKTINEILELHTKLSKDVIKSSIMTLVENRLKQLFSGPAFIELGSKQLNRLAQPHMSKLNVNAISVKEWLYGIYNELNEINFDTTVNPRIDYNEIDNYISSDISRFKDIPLPLEIKSLNHEELLNSDTTELSILVNYVATPKEDISALDTLAMVYKQLVNISSSLKLSTYVHKLPDINNAKEYKEKLDKVSQDATSTELSEIDAVMDTYKTYLTRLSTTTEELVTVQSTIYNDLMLVAATQKLLGVLTGITK